jgi:ribosomal protein S18 acetylase RimI-like enzyme
MMRIRLSLATPDDAEGVAALRATVAHDLLARYGKGHWCSVVSVQAVLLGMRRGRTYVAKHRNMIVATLTLSTRKPWAIDRSYFTRSERPLYLTGMAVAPAVQRSGIGRSCLTEAVSIGRGWPGSSICLDAYDAAAGAGEFYRTCGFREVGRALYRGVPLIYFELLL